MLRGRLNEYMYVEGRVISPSLSPPYHVHKEETKETPCHCPSPLPFSIYVC
jgi:hypothetical protein